MKRPIKAAKSSIIPTKGMKSGIKSIGDMMYPARNISFPIVQMKFSVIAIFFFFFTFRSYRFYCCFFFRMKIFYLKKKLKNITLKRVKESNSWGEKKPEDVSLQASSQQCVNKEKTKYYTDKNSIC